MANYEYWQDVNWRWWSEEEEQRLKKLNSDQTMHCVLHAIDVWNPGLAFTKALHIRDSIEDKDRRHEFMAERLRGGADGIRRGLGRMESISLTQEMRDTLKRLSESRGAQFLE